MKQVEIKVIAAASYFAHVSGRVGDIAEAFGVDTRTVRRWASHVLWDQTLETLGYAGDRIFEVSAKRSVEREMGEVFEAAREAYLEAANRGEPKHKLASLAAGSVGLPPRRVREWAKKYKWLEETPENRNLPPSKCLHRQRQIP